MDVFREFILVATVALGAMGCGHKRPYARADAPSSHALLKQIEASTDAVAVPDASVIVARMARLDLAFLAETPTRFRGTVTKAGNELVSLAFHEKGYGLRYKGEAFPTGFYDGPPDPCAVEALLGVPFSYPGLVNLVLGGAPVIQAPYSIVTQGWNRSSGYEELVLRNERHIQELRFSPTADAPGWRFVGGALWVNEDGAKGKRLWMFQHDRFSIMDGVAFPGRTKIRAPGKRRDVLVVINYGKRDLNPPFARRQGPAANNPDQPNIGPGKQPGWDDKGWEDEGWEDEGWEDEPATSTKPGSAPNTGLTPSSSTNAVAQDSAVATQLAAQASASPGSPAPSSHRQSQNSVTQPVPIPEVFTLKPDGLTPRGDLCR